ncbi:THAP domain-containing protein 7 [Chanos chanos]|uniref:THAP domain-containing protein 7 n=1 Tax=Chanos chanos TaxID=29144 RepID=A0A6J2WLR7_CHACN|nr:THAP domain-containing protein 7 [Chanos chanos]
MPRHCSAAGCKSRDTKESRVAGITFHRLPKRGTPRRTLWIINSRRKGPEGKGQWDPQNDFIYFCSKHFTPESFELSGVSGYRRLKDDAVPTVFETLSLQKGRSGNRTSRGRGKQADVSRDVEASNNQDVLKGSDTGNATGGKEDESPKTANDSGANAMAPLPLPKADPAQQGVSGGPPQSSCDPPPDPSTSASSPRPPSPSCYMRRLPPPPGFYVPKEHSYAQLCPLVWRKRYDKAIDNLEKALRLLSAARRRENRLRHALLRLRESRLRSTLSRIRDGTRIKEARGRQSSWALQRGEAAKSERGGLEENDLDGVTEDLDLLTEETGWRGQTQASRERLRVEEEEGCCFYCGRGREEDGSKEAAAKAVSQRASDVQKLPSRYKKGQEGKRGRGRVSKVPPGQRSDGTGVDDGEPKECYFYYCQPMDSEEGVQVVTMEMTPPRPEKEGKASTELHGNAPQQFTLLPPPAEMHLQMPGLSGSLATLQDATNTTVQLQQVQILQSSPALQPRLLLTDMTTSDKGATENLQEEEQQHVFWVQEGAEGRLLLLPLAADNREKGGVSVEGVMEDTGSDTVLVSAVGFQQEPTEEKDGLNAETEEMGARNAGLRDRQSGHQSNVRSGTVSGDVRERLKEHLEGFQLQLSNEFID